MQIVASLRSSARSRVRVGHALMMREAIGKHGHETLGFFWLFGEPLFLLVGISIIWTFAHITHGSDVEVIPFALSTYSYLTLWRHIAGGSTRVIRSNRQLSYFRNISMLDVVVTKAVLETLTLFSTFTVAYIPLFLMHLCPLPYDPLLIVGGFFFTGWFSLAFGLLLASVSEVNETFHHLIAAIMYITLPVTGAFTMQEWLPASIQKVMAWSPLVNSVEMLRGGVFPPSAAIAMFDTRYLVACCATLTCVGIISFCYAERVGEA